MYQNSNTLHSNLSALQTTASRAPSPVLPGPAPLGPMASNSVLSAPPRSPYLGDMRTHSTLAMTLENRLGTPIPPVSLLPRDDGPRSNNLSPSDGTISRRPSISRMARPTTSSVAARTNVTTFADMKTDPPTGHLALDQAAFSSNDFIDDYTRPIHTSRQRLPSMSKMARPTQTRSNSAAQAQHASAKLERAPALQSSATPQRMRRPSTLSSTRPANMGFVSEARIPLGEARSYYENLYPRLMSIQAHHADGERIAQAHHATQRINALGMFFDDCEGHPYSSPLTEILDARYNEYKTDIENLFDELSVAMKISGVPPSHLTSSPSSGSIQSGMSIKPNRHHANSSFTTPSSVKAAERRLGSDSSFSDARGSLDIPGPIQTRRPSWESDSSTDFASGGHPSSGSTKGDHIWTARHGPYVPTRDETEDGHLATDNHHSHIKYSVPQPIVSPANTGFGSISGTGGSRTARQTSLQPTDIDDCPYYSLPVDFDGPSPRPSSSTSASLHPAPQTASPAARRKFRAQKSIEKMNSRGDLPEYKYHTRKDLMYPSERQPVRGRDGNVARFFGDYMQVGDTFEKYNPPNDFE